MAESNYLSDVLSEIDPLVTDTLNYELKLRGIQPAQAPSVKRVQLARELVKDREGSGNTQWPFMPMNDDLRCCASLLTQFESILTSASRTMLTIENAVVNLLFLKVRVERFNTSVQNDRSMINMLKANIQNAITRGEQMLHSSQHPMTPAEEIIDLVGTTDSNVSASVPIDINPLFASLNLNSSNAPRTTQLPTANSTPTQANNNYLTNQTQFNKNVPLTSTSAFLDNPVPRVNLNHSFPNANQMAQSSNVVPNALNFDQKFQNPNQYGQIYTPPRRDHKMYKWNVKFSGESTKYDAIDFIQKVNAIARSRGVTDQELFESAIEFFSGEALKWYYAQQHKTHSWSELSRKLISDFIEVNYYDNLLDTIRQTQQSQSESIVHFFTHFEDKCSRLQTPLSQRDQIHIIKKNVLPKYRPFTTLTPYNTLSDLKEHLKQLEASMLIPNERNVTFDRTPSAHTSRYDSYRGNRSYGRSPSNGNNASRSNYQSPTRSNSYRSGTPIPSDSNRDNSYDRSDKRNQSPYNKNRTNESYDRNKNARSNSRDSVSSQQRNKSPSHLNR